MALEMVSLMGLQMELVMEYYLAQNLELMMVILRGFQMVKLMASQKVVTKEIHWVLQMVLQMDVKMAWLMELKMDYYLVRCLALQ